MSAVRSVMIRVGVDGSQAVRGAKDIGAAYDQAGTQIERSGKRANLSNEQIGRGARNIALAGGAALFAIERTNMAFDKQMSAVEAATGKGGAALGRFRDAAIDAGAKTAFSATEAAAGIENLAKAGVSSRDILGGGLTGALDLAAAGEMQVADAAEAAASAMTQFSLKGKDVPHIADLLAAAAGKAQGEVSDMAAALNQSGLVAAQTGLSIEETTGALAAFASNGLIGSDAGTSFKTMLMSLNPRSADAAKMMKSLNIEAYDAQGKFIGLEKYAGKLRKGLSGLTDEGRAKVLKTIFGSDAIRAANILYKEGAKGIGDWIRKTDDAGFAAETAAKKTDNLAGDIERFTGSLESAFLKSGSGSQDALRDIVRGAEDAVDAFNRLPKSVQEGTVKVIALATAVAGAVYVASKIKGAFDVLRGVRGGVARGAAAGVVGGGVQKVFVVNPGFGVPGKGTPAVVPGGLPTAAKLGGVAGFLSKAAPWVKAGSFIALAIAAGKAADKFGEADSKAEGLHDAVRSLSGQMGITGWALRKLDDALVPDKAERTAAALRGVGSGAAAAQGGLQLTNLALGKAGRLMDQLPAEVQTAVRTNAADTTKEIRKLARQYDLTPRQIRTLIELAGGPKAIAEADRTAKGIQRALDKIKNPSLDNLIDAGRGKKPTGPKNKPGPIKGGTQDLLITPIVGKPDFSRFRRELKNLPAAVRTRIETPGAVTSMGQIRKLGRQYDLTPKQVRTIARVLGIEPSRKGVKGLQGDLDKAGRTRSTPQVNERGAAGSRTRVASLQSQIRALRGKIVEAREQGAGPSSGRVAGLRSQIAALRSKVIYITTVRQNRGASGNVGRGSAADAVAMGGIYASVPAARAYALGDIANHHQPELAGPGLTRVWREPETQGESYIPLANDYRRPRARAIAAETVALLGGVATFANGGTTGPVALSTGSRATSYVDLGRALRGIQISGTVEGPFGPQQLVGIIEDVVDASNQQIEHARSARRG